MNPQDFDIPGGPTGFIFKHLWIVFILMTVINTQMAWHRSVKSKIEAKPELEKGYRTLYRNALLWMNVPWALMGFGLLSGRVTNIFEYLMPSAGNPNVLLWWGAMGVWAAGSTLWIFTGGAERLAAHPGLLYIPESTKPERIKFFWLIACAWNVFCGLMLFLGFPFSMKGDDFALIFPFAFPFFLVGMWFFVGYMLGQMSGWANLAEAYRSQVPYEGEQIATSGRMGMANYNGVVRLGADEAALHLSMLFLFRVGHAPLMVPWSSIRVSSEKRLFTEYVRFQIDQTILDVRKKDVQKLGRKGTLPAPLEQFRE